MVQYPPILLFFFVRLCIYHYVFISLHTTFPCLTLHTTYLLRTTSYQETAASYHNIGRTE